MLLAYKQQKVAVKFECLEMDVNIMDLTVFAGLLGTLWLDDESRNYAMSNV